MNTTNVEISTVNPVNCTPNHSCGKHPKSHVHSKDCGHATVNHENHTDYVVDGHLHHPHNGHCDDHGILNGKKS